MSDLLIFREDRCIGCFSCMVACNQKNHLPAGLSRIQIVRVEEKLSDNSIHVRYRAHVCRHCNEPKCATECPTGAIIKRDSGIITIDQEQCIGCGLCIDTCPYCAISTSSVDEFIQKCTLCDETSDTAVKPACIAHCQARAISYSNTALHQ